MTNTEPETYFDPQPESLDHVVASAPKRDTVSHDDDAEADQYRDAAFSSEFFWKGEKLYPLSVERYSIFLSHRLSMGAPRLFAALSDGGAFYPDALRLLWLCSTTPLALSRVRSDPARMQEAIDAWAEKNAPINMASEVIGTAIRMFNFAHANDHESIPDGNSSPDHGRKN